MKNLFVSNLVFVCFRREQRAEARTIKDRNWATMHYGGNRLLGGLVSVFIVFIFIFSLSSFSSSSLVPEVSLEVLASIKPRNINPRLPNYVYIQRESDPEFKIILLWNTFFEDPSFGFRYH